MAIVIIQLQNVCTENMVNAVYADLKDRKIHPSGSFDTEGRWWAEHRDLIDVRAPSRRFPYSEMLACRTRKYVAAVQKKFNCKSVEELRAMV